MAKISLKLESALFILSIDISNERKITDNESNKCEDFLLRVLEENKIPATWAITGDFLLDPSYKRGNLRDRDDSVNSSCTNIYNEALNETSYLGESFLKKIISNKMNHEIGYHSFSHPVFTLITRQCADAEINAGMEIAKHFGFVLKSFVYPQNKVAHTDVLKEHGLLIYRGDTLMKSNLRAPLFKKINGVINEVVAPPVLPEWKKGIWELPGSMYFADPKYPLSLLPRAKLGLHRAIWSKKVFHVWMHHWNLLEYNSLSSDFEYLMRYVSEKRDAGKIKVMTMGELARDMTKKMFMSEKQD